MCARVFATPATYSGHTMWDLNLLKDICLANVHHLHAAINNGMRKLVLPWS